MEGDNEEDADAHKHAGRPISRNIILSPSKGSQSIQKSEPSIIYKAAPI
jgi:hypothetical protein